MNKVTWQPTSEEIMRFIGVAAVILIAAKLGQYLFFEWKTSPAILWPPAGLALAIIWLWGYRYAIPVFIGLFIASATGPLVLIPAVLTTPLGQTLGSVAGVYVLRRFGFNGSFSHMKNVGLFLIVITVTCGIAPSITTLISAMTGNLSLSAYISWSRSWAGYVLSCLILTPLIISWSRAHYAAMKGRWVEPILASLLLIGSVYGLFWRPLPPEFSFIFFAFFFLALFWFCLRFPTMVVMSALSFMTAFGILGIFVVPNPESPLNTQLFATELFLFLVIPIFYSFSALIKERFYAVIELREAMQKIERENVVKSEFIAVLAHELRNPLAPVKTTLEILGLQNVDDETRVLVARSLDQVRAMRRLLDDLLDVTRITQGTFQLQRELTQLAAVLDHCTELTRSLFDKDHTITVSPPCDTSVWINIDPVRLEQALVNLINNAAKYTPKGGRIEVLQSVEGDVLELSIKDNGIGIAEENLEEIFKAFWQVRTNISSSISGGIGVGLSLTKHIIELHGGTIRAESAGVGKGSTFIISLPGVVDTTYVPPPILPRQRETLFPWNILVVDDNHAAADSLVKLLGLKRHVAQAAYTGGEALERVKELNPEVVLLDIGLTDMDGYEVARQMRKNGFTKTLIALSGYGQKEDIQKAMDAGCNHHFTKPLAIARLEEYLAGLQ